MHHCCTFPGHNGPTCGGRLFLFLLLSYMCKWPNHSSKIIEISTKYSPHAYKNKSLYTNNGIIVMF